MTDLHALLQDPKIEAVLERAYREWKTQRRRLLWRFEADNRGQREYMADPRNGFRAIVLRLKDGMEAAVYTGSGLRNECPQH